VDQCRDESFQKRILKKFSCKGRGLSNSTKTASFQRLATSGDSAMITDRWKFITKLECGPMPNLMVALPNIGGALCSTPQSLADTHY